ncbi:threonine synthase [Pontibacter sp. G13]|uniref:threonine synthase n=1 Tax=Pontibacter sp. G13 TaxID=3074898 RepID=UPI00288C1C10|nr:threonine synthase [Pontibacter sp. G13]WNJ18939.1 threonine synthase [Pontibacter sp. G13]
MLLYSTRNAGQFVDLKEAVLNSLPKDKGLYMPNRITPLPESFFRGLPNMTFPELAKTVTTHLLSEAVDPSYINEIIEQAVNFDAPIVSLKEDLHILELFHGPTLAFKDFGARFMAGLMGHFVRNEDRELTILVATSGDTGGAVANGFHHTPGVNVVILYPKGKVSKLQEKQLTTLGGNIQALEVDGTFDDCQRMVKTAFLDEDLQQRRALSSANSINIARLIPQSFYYFRAWQQLKQPGTHTSFCVPSGNFGNLTAGLLAQKLGLPCGPFIAATNSNDIVPTFLKTGSYDPRPSVATISNAMDVGNPSNWARILDLFGENWGQIRAHIKGFAYSDEQTREAIKEVYQQFDYQIDPHGAVGYLAAQAFQAQQPNSEVVILETAHPAKFPDTVEAETGKAVCIPEALAKLADLEGSKISISRQFEDLKTYLMD